MNLKSWLAAAAVAGRGIAAPEAAKKTTSAKQQLIDTQKSVMTVRVNTGGLFAAFAHDHDIAAPIAGGSVDVDAKRVEVRVNAGELRVKDAKASAEDRAKIQKTMLGPEVLDSRRYPEILFRSTAVEGSGPDSWTVRGNLTLREQTQAVAVKVREKGGHYVGDAVVKQTDFGIKPVRIAGGTVRVKDEVQIQFDILLAR